MRFFLACALIPLVCSCSGLRPSTMPQHTQKPENFQKSISQKIRANYLLYLPPEYEKGRKNWPLMLFLHGAGERGSNVWQVARHGPPKLIEEKQQFPFIIVSPQCPIGETWSSEVLMALLDHIIDNYRVETNRVYLTGLSMGGYGTWRLGLLHPERFAAIAPICGGGEMINVLLVSRKNLQALKTMGIWAFHGAKDPTVKLEESERMVNALTKVGCTDIELTVYPEATHDSWTETYQNPRLYEWFLEHKR